MIVRILEATASIPRGFSFQVEELSEGTVIEQEYNGSSYNFPVEKVEHLGGNQYRVSNSNVVSIVEVFEG